jgi:formate hydrogenlyase subunit 3/multisubunit Na+/H+ antiporter MnhD subunit
MVTKIILSLITGFLLTLSIYLIITGKKVEGSYYNNNGWGWVHNSFNGYLLLAVAIGFLIALIFVFRGKKIKL